MTERNTVVRSPGDDGPVTDPLGSQDGDPGTVPDAVRENEDDPTRSHEPPARFLRRTRRVSGKARRLGQDSRLRHEWKER